MPKFRFEYDLVNGPNRVELAAIVEEKNREEAARELYKFIKAHHPNAKIQNVNPPINPKQREEKPKIKIFRRDSDDYIPPRKFRPDPKPPKRLDNQKR